MTRFNYSVRRATKPGPIPKTTVIPPGHTLYPFVFDEEHPVEVKKEIDGIEHIIGSEPRE